MYKYGQRAAFHDVDRAHSTIIQDIIVTACDLWEVYEPIRANSALANITMLSVTRRKISSKNNSDKISLYKF